MDTDIALRLLQQCQQLEPASYRWAGELGDLYAFMAGRKEGAEKAGLSVLALEQYEKAITLNKQERSRQRDRDRSALLRDAAEAAFDVGQLAKAKSYATELLLEYGHDLTAYSYSDAAHYGNIILGRIALREGDLAKAKEHLLIAGRTPKLAGRTFFIPDMNLVRELFAKNERDAVLEYLQLCGTIYESQHKVFQRWEQMVRKGETPSFNIYER
jgi:tetratricopeptide (TPR) repeat protein